MNARERKAKEALEAQGLRVFRNGAPDFFAVRGGKLIAVEVKSETDRLTQAQRDVRRILQAAGLDYRLIRVRKDLSLVEDRQVGVTLERWATPKEGKLSGRRSRSPPQSPRWKESGCCLYCGERYTHASKGAHRRCAFYRALVHVYMPALTRGGVDVKAEADILRLGLAECHDYAGAARWVLSRAEYHRGREYARA